MVVKIEYSKGIMHKCKANNLVCRHHDVLVINANQTVRG